MSARRLRASACLLMAAAMASASAPVAGSAPTTRLVSVDPQGSPITVQATSPRISRTGRYVVFESSGRFSPGLMNRSRQIHLRDRTAGTTTRVSVSSTGEAANGSSSLGGISANGRWVVFSSTANNLVPLDTNGVEDVFVRDVVAGVTVRASVTSLGAQANDESYQPVISADGHTVAFTSKATNLAPNDTNDAADVFVRELGTFATYRVSVTSMGLELPSGGDEPSISGDGRYVAFGSTDPIDDADTNDYNDVYLRDRTDAETTWISRTTSGGVPEDGASYQPTIAADGSVIGFVSTAPNLVPVDKNGTVDAFLWIRATNKVKLITRTPTGAAPKGETWVLGVSADGTRVAFISDAPGFVANDTNGTIDAFVLDRTTGDVRRVSVRSAGGQVTAPTWEVAISGDGRFAAMESRARLSAADTDSLDDVFVRGELP